MWPTSSGVPDAGVFLEADAGLGAARRPFALSVSSWGQTSLVMAMTAPIRTKSTIRIWTTIQKRGSCMALVLLDNRLP